MRKSPKKLQLNRETVKKIGEQHLVGVAGGATWGNWSCDTSPCCGCPDQDSVINCNR